MTDETQRAGALPNKLLELPDFLGGLWDSWAEISGG